VSMEARKCCKRNNEPKIDKDTDDKTENERQRDEEEATNETERGHRGVRESEAQHEVKIDRATVEDRVCIMAESQDRQSDNYKRPRGQGRETCTRVQKT
jgi:hypothetical protein